MELFPSKVKRSSNKVGNFSTLEETRDRLAHVVYAVTWALKNIVNKFSRGKVSGTSGGGGREGKPILIGFFCCFCVFVWYIYLFTIKINDSCRQ